MGVGLIYPNPKTETRRIVGILLVLISVVPLSIMILMDIYNCWKRRDIINIIRHSTVVGPFLGGIFKMFIMYYKKIPAKGIVDEIDKDYESFNNLPSSYKSIINKSISNSLLYSEKCWAITVITCVMTFPFMAVALNIYNFLFKSEPTKHMVHDLIIPFMEPEDRFDSPTFEIMFVYMLYACLLYVINFTGYDGFFGLCINHACLKMELYCKAVEDALQAANEADIHDRIVDVIREQNKLKRYVDLIQDTFNIWLGLILIATMIQIGTCMYHITEGFGLDLRYIIFMTGTVIHIYLPCRYSAKLKHMSMETSTLIYCSGWETITSNSIRKTILFMIAMGQIPIEITAFNLLIFDMDLFVTILNSSYSMYTLLRS
ncbi:odorant receptor 13a-like [Nymphalis io]|uniref:odorant receptor 13a-like n=1 Tax=Inachis io TaxID=171585 RepID=UPI002168B3D0|nr:odorant receptor 13a-like [Nymphalis io]